MLRTCHRYLGILLVAALTWSAMTGVSASANEGGTDSGIVIHVTDFGINQWRPELAMGGSLEKAANRLFAPDAGVVGIAVPMPPDAMFNSVSPLALRAQIAKAVKGRIRKALARGEGSEFEVQIIQNINTLGYTDPARQMEVDRFGAIAYAAIGDVIEELEQEHHSVAARAVTLSNGTKVLAASVASLVRNGRPYLQGADLMDGRAMKPSVIRLARTLGENHVRLFITRGDLPAPAHRSIGNFDTATEIKDELPGVSVYYLIPKQLSFPWKNHVAPIRPGTKFEVREYIGNGFMIERLGETGSISQEALIRRPVGKAGKVQRWWSGLDGAIRSDNATPTLRHRQETWIRVLNKEVELLNVAVTAYAEVYNRNEKLERELLGRSAALGTREKGLLRLAKVVSSANNVRKALARDMAAQRYGRYTFVGMDTLQAISEFGLDVIDAFDYVDRYVKKGTLRAQMLSHVGGFRELVTALAQHAGKRSVDVEITDHYLNALLAFRKVGLQGGGKLTGGFAMLESGKDVGVALVKLQNSAAPIEAITELLDSVNALAWAGLGMAVCDGDYRCTVFIREVGRGLAVLGRTLTQDIFSRFLLAVRGDAKRVLNDYLALQRARIAHGNAVQPISAIYGRDLLRKIGFSNRQIDQLDALSPNAVRNTLSTVKVKVEKRQTHRRIRIRGGMPVPASGGDGGGPPGPGGPPGGGGGPQEPGGPPAPGGVDMNVGAPEIEQRDLSEMREAVLGR